MTSNWTSNWAIEDTMSNHRKAAQEKLDEIKSRQVKRVAVEVVDHKTYKETWIKSKD